jgi:selenide, water dikinase
MYGLAVIGRVDPRNLLKKGGAAPGDRLVLTKPLGTGLVTTALKQGRAEIADVRRATASMSALNRAAGQAAIAAGATAATDVTGFGLMGHAVEMAGQGGVALVLDIPSLPMLPGTLRYADMGCVPGGTWRNHEGFSRSVKGLESLGPPWTEVLFDPQTSGGLLIAVGPDGLDSLLRGLRDLGAVGVVVGSVESGSGVRLRA